METEHTPEIAISEWEPGAPEKRKPDNQERGQMKDKRQLIMLDSNHDTNMIVDAELDTGPSSPPQAQNQSQSQGKHTAFAEIKLTNPCAPKKRKHCPPMDAVGSTIQRKLVMADSDQEIQSDGGGLSDTRPCESEFFEDDRIELSRLEVLPES